jgi:hypothetical protein
MVWWWAIAEVARGGCAVDPEEPARLAEAPLIAVGIVVDVEVVEDFEDGGRWTAVQHVVLEPPLRGRVTSGALNLRSALTGGSCPGDRVFGTGQRVVLAVTPDPAGEVRVSPCAGDVRGATAETVAWAEALARPRRPGETFAGSPRPSHPLAATPTPGVPDEDIGRARLVDPGRVAVGDRWLSPGGEVPEGRVVANLGEDGVVAVWPVRGWSVVGRAPLDALDRVVTRPVALAPGVEVAPGTALSLGSPSGGRTLGEPDVPATYARPGLEVVGRVPLDAVGAVWVPAATPAVDPGEAVGLTRATTWSATPSGPPVGRMVPRAAAVFVDGPAEGGVVPVWIRAPGLAARGWISADVVDPVVTPAGGMLTGMVGEVVSGRRVPLGAGAVLASLDGAHALAVATEPTCARLLLVDAGRMWVVARTAWGELAGQVRCGEGCPEAD